MSNAFMAEFVHDGSVMLYTGGKDDLLHIPAGVCSLELVFDATVVGFRIGVAPKNGPGMESFFVESLGSRRYRASFAPGFLFSVTAKPSAE